MLTRLELKQIKTAIDGMTKFTNGDFMLQKTSLLKLLETFTEEIPVPTKVETLKKIKKVDRSQEFSHTTRVRTIDGSGIEDIYQAISEDDLDDSDGDR